MRGNSHMLMQDKNSDEIAALSSNGSTSTSNAASRQQLAEK